MHLPWRDRAYGNGPAISTSVRDDEIAALADLARGRTVLEFGSAFGYTSVGMALAGARHVTAVDPHWQLQSRPVMEANLAAYGVAHKVTIEEGYSGAHEGTGYGLVFIDGDHQYAACRDDLIHATRVLTPGGSIACHDYGEDCCCPGVRQAVDEVWGVKGGVVAGSLWVVTL